MGAAGEALAVRSAAGVRVGRVRWIVCALLFAAVVLSYIDRQVLSVLKPTLQRQYGWSEIGYGDVVFWFQAAYGIGYIVFGRLLDRIGAKLGYALAVGLWTFGHVAHVLVTSTLGFALMRIPLAFGEAGTYPSALAAAADWFPRRERSLAIGVFNAGANVGAIVTPLIVPAITLAFGWRMAFIVTGLFTVVWLVAWLSFYRRPEQHPMMAEAELAHIRSEPDPAAEPGARASWRQLLRTRETWAYIAGRFLIDPVWWTFLFWLPDFFDKRYGVKMTSYGPPLVAIYLLADVGSILGGWTSSRLLSRGVSANVARKSAMLGAALIVTPVAFGAVAPNQWIAVLLIGLACAGHQGFSSNLFALPSDLFPRKAASSVIGLGGAAGALGSMLMAKYAGWVLQTVGSYTPIFVVSAFAYLVALTVVHMLTPRYAPVAAAALPA
jgi:ACS family hexuronate transporter-like MFS transporter